MEAAEAALTTTAGMLTLAGMNHAISDKPPAYDLQFATHWFLLMSISAWIVKTGWWIAAVSSFGAQVCLLHWTMVLLRARPTPYSSKALQNLNCYLILPIIMIFYAYHTNAYASAPSRTIASTAVMTSIITTIICVHDHFSEKPVYPNLPFPVPILSLGAFGISTLWLLGMNHFANAPRDSEEWWVWVIGLSVVLFLIVAGIVCGGFVMYQQSKNVRITQRTPRIASSKNSVAGRAAKTSRA